MPSVSKARTTLSRVKSQAKTKISKLKTAVKSVAGKNGHGGAIRVAAKTPVLKRVAAVTGKAGRRTYFFGGGKAEGKKEMKNLLGGKGANLAEMANIGLAGPPGFTRNNEI